MKLLKELIEEAVAKENAPKDYYEILGVERTATVKEIKSAYRKLVRIWHPDKNDGSKAAAQTFMDIVEAYEVLSQEEVRGKYDRGEDVSKAGRKGAGTLHMQQRTQPIVNRSCLYMSPSSLLLCYTCNCCCFGRTELCFVGSRFAGCLKLHSIFPNPFSFPPFVSLSALFVPS